MRFLKAAFHIHTVYSKDSSFKTKKLIDLCLENQVEVLIVADHNTLLGYSEIKKILETTKNPLILIPCEEIATREGEIAGLFLKQEIPRGLSLEETIHRIKGQGGLTCLPHPFDSVRRERIKDKKIIDAFIHDIDIIEVFNSRNIKKKDDQKALDYAIKHDKAFLWGSDAHFDFEFRNCFFEIPVFEENPYSFLEQLKKARPLVQRKGLRGFIKSVIKKYFHI